MLAISHSVVFLSCSVFRIPLRIPRLAIHLFLPWRPLPLLFTRWFSVAAAADVSSKTTNFYRRQATLTLVRAPSASVRPPPSSLLAPSMSLSLSLRPRGGPLLRPPRAVLEHVLAAPSLFSPSPSRNGPTRAGMGRASNIGQVFKCRPPALPCPWRTQGYSGRVVWSITRQ